jgi:hypothetical protein
MNSMLVDVNTTDGVFLAKVVKEDSDKYKVRYLVAKTKELFDYEDTIDEIDKECVCGVYDPDDTEEHAGFVRVEGGFIQLDEDEDYEPSECCESESDSESLVDEDEDSVEA